MDESEQAIAAFFHLSRSLRRKRPLIDPNGVIMRAVLKRAADEERRALRQARLEWAEDRDAWERQWR